MTITKRITSLLLALCLLVSIAAVGIVPAAADTTCETYAQATVQGSNILHCFDWSYNNIRAALPEIAAAGYTAVQTSPVQPPKDYNASWTNAYDQWWKLYQPLGLRIADGDSWLGSIEELTMLCIEAEEYGVKVIVDIVANHLANNGDRGGTYDNLNYDVDGELQNRDYYHEEPDEINDESRYNITHYHMGQPDLNTGNHELQQKVIHLLHRCIDCGVDGFRFDAAKHIEVPEDPDGTESDFWTNVIDAARSYTNDELFIYGDILGSPGPDCDMENYTQFMSITDSYTGDRALAAAVGLDSDTLSENSYVNVHDADKSVLWVESHGTYMGDSGSAGIINTASVSNEDITRAWAIVGSRAESTSLFFARPSPVMGLASTDDTWKSDAVAEVNKFKNHFEGTSEYLASSGNSAYIERGTKGVVISKLDGDGSVSLPAHQMARGTYTDQITGNTFTVANGKITGTVGDTDVAVVYNADDDALSTITEPTLYLKPNSNWTQSGARFVMYVYNSVTGAYAWADMVSDSSGYYSADVPDGTWTNVIFVCMNPSSSENRWDAYDGEGHVWNRTNDLFPDSCTNCYTIADGAWSSGDGSWSWYNAVSPSTVAPSTVAPSTASAESGYTFDPETGELHFGPGTYNFSSIHSTSNDTYNGFAANSVKTVTADEDVAFEGNCNSMFSSLSACTSIDLSNVDMSQVTYMSSMFDGCSSLTNLSFGDIDTSNVEEMSYMFLGCSSLENLDLRKFDTSSVTSMANMFRNCSSLKNLDLSNFEISSVTSMENMFRNCSSLENLDLSSFDTINVTDMSYMFSVFPLK